MSPANPESLRPTCKYKKYDGELCRRTVEYGEGLCWQHAKSWRHKWKSLTRNQSILFVLAVLSLLFGLPGILQIISPTGKGFMQLGKVWFNTKQIQANGRLKISVWVKNEGGEPVDNMYPYFQIRLVRLGPNVDATDREIHAAFLKDAEQAHAKMLSDGKRGVSVGKGHGIWETMEMPNQSDAPLSQDQVDGIMQGRLRIYVYTWVRWRDAPHDLDFCQWLQPPTTAVLDNDNLIWHVCSE